MSYYFLDSSALVKRYMTETGTAWIRNLTDISSRNIIIISRITSIEVVAALARRVKSGSLTTHDSNLAISKFKAELTTHFRLVELTDILSSRAIDVTEKHQLRAYDAVQLAISLAVYDELLAIGAIAAGHPYVLVSADNELNNAASLEGLAIENPNNYP